MWIWGCYGDTNATTQSGAASHFAIGHSMLKYERRHGVGARDLRTCSAGCRCSKPVAGTYSETRQATAESAWFAALGRVVQTHSAC